MDSTEFFACLALRHTPGVGPKTWKKILDAFGSAYDALRQAGSWNARGIASERVSGECVRESWRQPAEEEFRQARRLGCAVITYFHPHYPERLREIPDPPILLYCLGDTELLCNPGLGVVGARKCTTHGLNATRTMAEDLSRVGLTVISGMAYGIDRQAHLGGLSGVGASIGVLGTGVDVIYPRENTDIYHRLAASGLLVTEYAPGTGPVPANFPRRNRIISGLSHAVIVAEAAKRSGSLITARLALEQGRDVYALPGHAGVPSHEGSNKLIKQGARLVDCADDILEDLHWLLSSEVGETPGGEHSSGEGSAGAESDSGSERVAETGDFSDAVENSDTGADIPAFPSSPKAQTAGANEQEARGSTPGRSGKGSDSVVPETLHMLPKQTSAKVTASDSVPGSKLNSQLDTLPGTNLGIKSGVKFGNAPRTPSADRKRQIAALSGDEGRVAQMLSTVSSLHVDQLGRDLNLGAGDISRILVLLEIKGLVRQLPGMYYALA